MLLHTGIDTILANVPKFLSYTDFMQMYVSRDRVSLYLWADIIKISFNGAPQAFNWSASACLWKQLTMRKEGNLTSFENNFRENLILNIISCSLWRVFALWNDRVIEKVGDKAIPLSLKLLHTRIEAVSTGMGCDIQSVFKLQIGLGLPQVNIRPWLCCY